MLEALRSGHTQGDGAFTRRASARLSDLHGGAPVLLTTSCTHALELAALGLGVMPGDEVVLPSFTFVSTANAFALRGARIRFADVDPGTWSMELPQVEAACTPETRVVVMVHYGGVSRDAARVREFCERTGRILVEDNAHGLFGTSQGRALGTFGALAALSFHATKNLSCGEGGALVVNDRALLHPLEVHREKGTDRARFLRGEVDRYTWRALGSSWLPSDVLAASLDAQLAHATHSQRRRHEIWDAYARAFAMLATRHGVTLQTIPEDGTHPAHMFAFLVPETLDRAPFLADLRARGIVAISHYEPLHRAPFARSSTALPVTESVASRIVRLPLHTRMTDGDVDRVLSEVTGALERHGRSRS